MILQNCNVTNIDRDGVVTFKVSGQTVETELEWVGPNFQQAVVGAVFGKFTVEHDDYFVPIEAVRKYVQRPGLRYTPIAVFVTFEQRQHYGHAYTMDFAEAEVEPLLKQRPPRAWMIATEKFQMSDGSMAHLIASLKVR